MSEAMQTQNSILRISDEKTLQLIELYEREECLWNTYIDDYKNRDKRQKATERIARKLDIKHFEARHVVIKFKNLRNSYCQELKKIAASISIGLSDDEQYRPRVFWFSKMDSFLRPHLQPARQQGYSQLNIPETEDRVKIERITDSDENNSEDYCIQEDSSHSYPVVEVDDSLASEDEPLSKRRAVRRTFSNRREDLNESFSRRDDVSETGLSRPDLSETVKNLEAKVKELTQEKEDYYDAFGKYVASLLRSMPKEKAMLLQPKVISLIVSGSGVGEGSVSQSDN